jgi:hypothetical protein
VEVTYTSPIGEYKVFQSDDIAVPRLTVATFRIDRFDDIDLPNTTPLTFELDADGTGQSVTRQQLGSKVTGLQVLTPYRVFVRPRMVIPGAPSPSTTKLSIDISRSRLPPAGLKWHSLYGPRVEAQTDGKVSLSIPPGNQFVRLVAEDQAGNRSFPRTVFVTSLGSDRPSIPEVKLFGESTTILPGATGHVPLSVFVGDMAVHRIVVDFSVRDRLSGTGGSSLPEMLEDFELSPELTSAHATVRVSSALGGMHLHLEIAWSAARSRSGNVRLGRLPVRIRPQAKLGSTYLLSGKGITFSKSGSQDLPHTLQVLSPLIRIWGGPQPTSLRITGPARVTENEEITLTAEADGVPVPTANAGWWVNSVTGLARANQLTPGSLDVHLTGQKAGRVKVSVVVGTLVSQTIITVLPNVKRPEWRRALPVNWLNRRRHRLLPAN